MEYNFDNERPIYIQLVEMLKIEIISGRIKSGEKLPSVRDFAMKAKVNPNTMQKALTELERENLIYTERTNGKYGTNYRNLIDNIKNEIALEQVRNFIRSMNNIGIYGEEIEQYMKSEANE